MHWGPRAITALCAIACAACSGSGGGGVTTTVSSGPPFPQGFFPVRLAAGGSGDVAFRSEGDLLAVAGTDEVTAVSRTDGSVTQFATVPGSVLLSIVAASDGKIFVGDQSGSVYSIVATGASSLLADTGSEPVTGLAIAPSGYGDFGGRVIAVSAGGIVAIDAAQPGTLAMITTEADYVDIAFSGATLFALDATDAEIDQVTADGVVSSFQADFVAPVGLAVDPVNQEILVADAGDDVLRVLPVAGGAPTDLAPYDFDADAPSGLAFDGLGALVFVSVFRGSVTLVGVAVPPIDATRFGFSIAGPTVGYGDLELDRYGALVGVANDDDDPNVVDDASSNFVFRINRIASILDVLASNIGAVGEDLLSLAIDPVSQTLYIGSRFGNLWRVDSGGGVALLASVPGTATVPAAQIAVLGLELAPPGFGAFSGELIATTSEGQVLAIDPTSPTPAPTPLTTPILTPSLEPARLSDLVFASDGTLYVLDNGDAARLADRVPRILVVTAGGGVSDLGADAEQLGLPDGIEIDEGGKRLLVTSGGDVADDQLLEVTLEASPVVTGIENIEIDDGFFPSGIVYDRLGTVVLRAGDSATILDGVTIFPSPAP